MEFPWAQIVLNCKLTCFLYSFKGKFVPNILHEKNKKKHLIFRYIDEVLSVNNENIHLYVDLKYPSELKIEKLQSSTSASYLDILFNIVIKDKLTAQLYDKRSDFYLSTVLFCITLQRKKTPISFYAMLGHCVCEANVSYVNLSLKVKYNQC